MDRCLSWGIAFDTELKTSESQLIFTLRILVEINKKNFILTL